MTSARYEFLHLCRFFQGKDGHCVDADDAVSENISFISVILLFRKREKILSRLNLLNSTSYGMIVMIQEPIDVNHIGGEKKKN